MRVPIPDDWDGKGWMCTHVEWPNSPQWIGLLTGILTLLTRGRYWDERTGTITDVQQIAREIFDRNYPFNVCGEGVEPEEPDQDLIHCLISSAVGILDEDLAMSLCGYNPNAFKIEDGKLFVRDFCGEWVEIGALTSPTEDPPPDIWGDVDPEPTFYACGKVEYIVDQFILFSNAVWAKYTDPFTFESGVRGSVTSAVNLDRARLYQWIPQLVLLDLVLDETDFNNAEAVQNAKCVAVGSVAADGVGTNEEVDAVVNALASAFTDQLGVLPEWHYYAYWKFVQETFGSKDCRLLMELGATNPTADCDCVLEDPYIGVVTFDDSRVIHLESQGSSLDVATFIHDHVMYFEVKGGLNENFQEVHWDEYLNASGTIQEIQVEWPLESADVPGYYPAEAWDDTNPTLLANYHKAPVLNPAADSVAYYPQPGKQVMVCTWVAPADLDSANLDFGIKLNPKDQDPNVQTYKFRAEITYAGPLR